MSRGWTWSIDVSESGSRSTEIAKRCLLQAAELREGPGRSVQRVGEAVTGIRLHSFPTLRLADRARNVA